MVSAWEIERYIKRHEDDLKLRIDENDMIINKENDTVLCSLDEFTDRMRKIFIATLNAFIRVMVHFRLF